MKARRAIGAILMAWLVLFSSTSFFIGIHLCMGDIQGVAFLSNVGTCAMEEQVPPCHKPVQDSCCEDETVVHDASEVIKLPTVSLNAGYVAIDAGLPPIPLAEIVPSSLVTNFPDYDPPLRSRDRTIQYRVLVI